MESRVQMLDDIASLVVQLEPNDEAALREIRAALHSALTSTAYTSAVKTLIVEALLLFDDPREDVEGGAEKLVHGLRALVESAVNAHESGTATPARPAPAVESQSIAVGTFLGPNADRPLLAEFIGECRDYLDGSEASLLRLEADASDTEAINTIFRAFHTIKGTSAFLGVELATGLAHEAETLLSKARDGSISCTGDVADVIFRTIDVLKGVMDGVEQALAGQEPTIPPQYEETIRQLRALDREPPAESPIESVMAPPTEPLTVSPTEPLTESPAAASASPTGAPSTAQVAAAAAAARGPRLAEMVRVRTDRLDRIIEMVGELVIAQSMLSQDATVREQTNYELSRKVGHAEKIVRELQDLSMGMRMVPLKAPFQKVARLARDLAHRHQKLVEFSAEGEDTEIDRNLVDVLADPLVHMIRNAVDHGIELPDDRERAGKPRAGQLRITASHVGGNVVVELHDDGRGLNRERIVAKAIAMRIIETADGLTDTEIFNLIFRPGFSTAEKVTDVSGRGVGMDVVRRNVESMRGRVEITSRPGQGSTFTIRLPLTLAITDGMLIRVGQERYLVPTEHIRVSFRPESSQLSTIGGRREVVMLRGEVMPVVRLHQLFNIRGAEERPEDALLMVIGTGRDSAAVLVDELLGQSQVVAKSLGDGLGRVPGVSGGAILGDGRVGLILDVHELVEISRHSGTVRAPSPVAEALAVA